MTNLIVKIPKQKIGRVCMDFLLLHAKSPRVVYSSYSARQAMNKRWGIDIDHHEFAYAIDLLVQQGKMVRVSNNSVYPQFRVRSES